MSLEYQTPFHPGPFASQQQMQQTQQQQPQATQQQQQQQVYAQSPNPHQLNPQSATQHAASLQQPGPPVLGGSSAAPQSQAFAPAPSYPGHNLSRPPPPQFHDGLMQQAPHFSSPAASFAGEWPSPTPACTL